MGEPYLTRFLPPADPGNAVSCAVCGCRLMSASGHEDGAWRHFPSLHAGRDARGCRPACIDALHDRSGRAQAYAGESGVAAA